MTRSRHNLRTLFFAKFPWPKSSLLREAEHASTKRGIRIDTIADSPGIRKTVNLICLPLVVTMTRPEAKICVRKISVTSLKSQGRVSNV